MKSIKAQGIVIKRMDLGEADRLLTIYTDRAGKVRALAKGSRRPLSKLAGHIEPFSHTVFELHEGKSFYVITGADLEVGFLGLRDDLEKTSLAYYLLEMVDALTTDNEAHEAVFELLRDGLTLLEHPAESVATRLFVTAFILKLLAEVGYLPELDSCVHCQKPLQPEDNFFSASLGGIVGPECRQEASDRQKINATALKAMRLFLAKPIEVVYRCTLSPQTLGELEYIIENYLQYHVGRQLYSRVFANEIAKG